MRVLLDTATFIRALTAPERLSGKAAAAIQRSGAIRELSVLSLSEIAIKQAVGKLGLGWKDTLAGIDDLEIRVLPYTAKHAMK